MSTDALENAKQQFLNSFESLNDEEKAFFSTFVKSQLNSVHINGVGNKSKEGIPEILKHLISSDEELIDDPVETLRNIADTLKEKVPLNAVLSSEKITAPLIGENADATDETAVHVDEFLYDDEEMEELIDEDKVKKYYCLDCNSKNIKELVFISHSMSRDALFYIFNDRLPTIEGKTVLDIGSRLGAVLYGAYVFTDAAKIIGVEMNKEFCKLQEEIIIQYKMTDRINVLHKRIEEASDVIELADVIILNNVFEFYLTEEEQIKVWQFLRKHIKKGTILVTRPHLETTFVNINTDINLKEWVKIYENPSNGDLEDMDEFNLKLNQDDKFCDLEFYEVL